MAGPCFVFSRRQSGRSTIGIHRHLTSHRNRFPTVCKDTYRACCQAVLRIDPIQQDWPHHCWRSQHSDCMLIMGRGWREGEPETCFVIKCTQHLSCCCLLMFRVQHFNGATLWIMLVFAELYSMLLSIKDNCKKVKGIKYIPKENLSFCKFYHQMNFQSLWRTLNTKSDSLLNTTWSCPVSRLAICVTSTVWTVTSSHKKSYKRCDVKKNYSERRR